jgi:hypothetical protein
MMAQAEIRLAAKYQKRPTVTLASSSPPPAPSETQHKTCREEKALRGGAHQEVRCRLESGWGGLLRLRNHSSQSARLSFHTNPTRCNWAGSHLFEGTDDLRMGIIGCEHTMSDGAAMPECESSNATHGTEGFERRDPRRQKFSSRLGLGWDGGAVGPSATPSQLGQLPAPLTGFWA